MHLTSFLLRLRCPGSCSAGGFPGIGWGSVIHGSCFLCSFLCNSLGLVPCSYLCSWERACFVLGGGCCSPEGVVVEEQKPQSFCFLRIHFRVALSNEHWRGPSRCVLGR